MAHAPAPRESNRSTAAIPGPSRYRILLVEDDPKIAGFVVSHLEKYGYDVQPVVEFDDVLGEFDAVDPQLVLLDVNLPCFDGYYWCRRIRTLSNVPILFLTARSSDMDQVMAIENGADDFIVKPFSLDVLTVKVKGALRRAYGEYAASAGGSNAAGHDHGEAILVAGVLWDRSRLVLEREGRRTALSRNEGMLMDALIRADGRVVSRMALLETLWDDVAFVDDNTLTVNVTRLRRKLEHLGLPEAIQTVRGSGYRLDLPLNAPACE